MSFAKLTWTKPHMLLLDEPSNHLDLDAVEALVQVRPDGFRLSRGWRGGLSCPGNLMTGDWARLMGSRIHVPCTVVGIHLHSPSGMVVWGYLSAHISLWPLTQSYHLLIILLTQGLAAFKGAVLMVSHDQHLIESTVDELWAVEDNTINVFHGTFEDYKKRLKS